MEELRVGFGSFSPPDSIETRHGHTGTDVECFRDLATSIGRKLVLVQVDPSASIPIELETSPFNGTLGAIENGTLHSYLDTNLLSAARICALETVPTETINYGIYSGTQATVDSSLLHFVVFNYPCLLLIMASFVIMKLVKKGHSPITWYRIA
ncbi:hypothetical protein PFISCL1PPCAC_16878, partial [Pristionchus fissidentatus]